MAVGLRPCSGAILVLVFALAQGIFWAGIAATFVMGLGTAITVAAIATLTVTATAFAARLAATRTGYGALALRGIEVVASIVVLLFGVALLAGYMASERLCKTQKALTKRGVKPSPLASMWQMCGAPKCCGISSAPEPAHFSSVIRRERRAAG